MKLSRGVMAALCAALLFGASMPAAKLLLGDVSPWLAAGLLYLGSGLGLSVVVAWRREIRSRLSRQEWTPLAGAIALGGVVGPLLLMMGLRQMDASAASLLLNAEVALTALVAWFVFRENFDRRIVLGMAALVAGAVLLTWGGEARMDLAPAAAILGACACWALDNNLTRKVAHADAVEIAALKGLVAGVVNTSLAFAISGNAGSVAWPLAATALSVGLVGFLGYGVSLALFVVALRELGTARASAYFAVAPFAGALLSIAALGEPMTARLGIAGLLMAAGVALHLSERHDHAHEHEPLEHDHEHEHDEHHQHAHDEVPSGRHAHPHRHERLTHRHHHVPDIHHRHDH